MRVTVNVNNIVVGKLEQIHHGEYNVNEFIFMFSEEYENLVKKAIFKFGDELKEMPIINNRCYLPSELLESDSEYFELGVYAYELIGDDLKIRYSPTPTKLQMVAGSYVKGAEGSEEITPTQFEQYTYKLDKGLTDLEDAIIDFKIKEETGYFDGPQGPQGPAGSDGTDGFSPIATVTKSGNTATISITDANGTTTASVSDGTNGTDGTDGFSPIASVEKVGNTATISITDANGTTTASVSDGTNGTDGFSPIASVEKVGNTATITITDVNGTTTATISDGTNGTDGTNGQDGQAATIAVGTVTTGSAGSSATVTNSGTSSAAIFDFSIPKGDTGEQGPSGINSSGTGYIKFEDGTMICYLTVPVTATISTAWNNVYRSGSNSLGSYTQTFLNIPICNINVTGVDGAWTVQNGTGSVSAPPAVYLLRPDSSSSTTYTVNVIAIGRWK